MELKPFLETMVEHGASDLYLTTAAAPTLRCQGVLKKLNNPAFKYGEVKTIAMALMTEAQRAAFAERPEMNLAHSEPGLGRFRVNVFKQRNDVGMVVRHIKNKIMQPHELELPPVLNQLIMKKHGLLLIVGATGTGKSSTVSSLIGYRNHKRADHIITIEDPIEYIHSHQKSIINQREIGFDTSCYDDALKNALRQSPDVVVIGEIRSRETMEHALAFADTGHLCVSTMHATNASQAIDRIVNFFPKDQKHQILHDLSLVLCGVVSQRLVPTVNNSLTPAVEVLIGSPAVSQLIKKGEISGLKTIMEQSKQAGMQTFDESLYKLFKMGKISQKEALHYADSENDLKLRFELERDDIKGESIQLSYDINEDDKSRTF